MLWSLGGGIKPLNFVNSKLQTLRQAQGIAPNSKLQTPNSKLFL
ncbi:hypothetical protein GXM_04970 [Nostoc sphaeroides CCNUC1]|uniref:Uncharacterized protein n=1 Tax=Nostoc sphaeroides CCNUC1 TaxID=2653204 RepID=A0A5P8W409_9NOSO|nr:hypothetical protein GXM_04970 [Nostoc sphaeroides CCNUC1]